MNGKRRDYNAACFQKKELQRPESLVEMGSVERRAPVSILPTLLPFDHIRLRITLQRDWEQIAETVQREESSNTRTHKAAAKHSCIGVETVVQTGKEVLYLVETRVQSSIHVPRPLVLCTKCVFDLILGQPY